MKKQLIIVGAGWSGIYMLKHALEEGIDAMILEERNQPLGNWHYTKLAGGVLRKTHATSSTNFMHPSDYPFKPETPPFPHHDLIEDHLLNYIDHFKLRPHIKFGEEVKKVTKKNNKWRIITEKTEHEADNVSIASGLNKVPISPSEKMYEKFKGKKMHTHNFNEAIKNKYKNKSILIIGGGETACDIANILSIDSKVFLSIRNGQWFQDRIFGAYEPVDVFFNRIFNLDILKPYVNSVIRFTLEFLWGKGGSGIDIWMPSSGYVNGFYNKSRDVVQSVALGEINARKGVKEIKERSVKFYGKENTWEDIDLIIFGTGYSREAGLKYLSENLITEDNYKFIFNPDDPTLSFIGMLRPFVGSVSMLTEVQTRLVAKVIAGKTELPSTEKRKNEIKKDKKKQAKRFPKDHIRMPFLVDPFQYTDEIAKKIGAKPKTLQLLFTHPILWFKVIHQPWSPFQYRIHDKDKKKRKLAIKHINDISKTTLAKMAFLPDAILLILIILPLLIVYTIINWVN